MSPPGTTAQRSLLRLAMAALVLVAVALSAPAWPAGTDPGAKPLPLTTLAVVSSRGDRHDFMVELAATEADRSVGLMFRWELASDSGMLFLFERDRHVSMWMRNTFIPLTMLFVRADGTIARIVDRATPLSEESIHSGEPIRAVVELAGGTASRLDLKPGDRIESPAFIAEPRP